MTPNAHKPAPIAMADESTRTLFVRSVQTPKASDRQGTRRPIAAKIGNLAPGRNAPIKARPIGDPTSMVRQPIPLSPICHPRASLGPGADSGGDDEISYRNSIVGCLRCRPVGRSIARREAYGGDARVKAGRA
jgi:hypothetical protein